MNINITKKYIDFVDNWKWIKKSEIPYLMEKFYQWDSSKSENVNSRWIGVWLSIVWKIIMEHNWSFKITSDTWEGFSFRVYF
jgi:K+-sensing histidine kinase KdpD